MRKGIIFTLDAMFALMFALIVLAASFFFLSQPSPVDYNTLKTRTEALSALAVLEKSGMLEQATYSSDFSEVEDYVNSFPYHLCARLSVKDAANSSITDITKDDCLETSELSAARRVYLTQNRIFYSDIWVWVK